MLPLRAAPGAGTGVRSGLRDVTSLSAPCRPFGIIIVTVRCQAYLQGTQRLLPRGAVGSRERLDCSARLVQQPPCLPVLARSLVKLLSRSGLGRGRGPSLGGTSPSLGHLLSTPLCQVGITHPCPVRRQHLHLPRHRLGNWGSEMGNGYITQVKELGRAGGGI